MKKNFSSSSKFAYNNDLLDERHRIRNESYDNGLLDLKIAMKDILDKYVDNDIVTRDNLEEWLIQELIKNFRYR